MTEQLKPGPIKGPHIRQSPLLETWEIRTGEYLDKDGWISCKNKYPIPEDTLKQIAIDWLIKNCNGCENGYTMELRGKAKDGKRERFKLSVMKDGFVEE